MIQVYPVRTDKENRRLNPSIALGTFIWYASEPDSIIYLYKGDEVRKAYLSDMLDSFEISNGGENSQ